MVICAFRYPLPGNAIIPDMSLLHGCVGIPWIVRKKFPKEGPFSAYAKISENWYFLAPDTHTLGVRIKV